MTQVLVESGRLPAGSFQLVVGSTGDLLSQLTGQDHLAFTGSNATGAMLRGTKGFAEKGVRVQTRRHTHIVSLLGVRHVILAVNKMDRIGYDKARFEAIAGEFVAYAHKLGVANVEVIPCAALVGVNVVARGTRETPWYTGRTLLEALEGIDVPMPDVVDAFERALEKTGRRWGAPHVNDEEMARRLAEEPELTLRG